VFRQTLETVESLDVLTLQQRELIGTAMTGRLRSDLEAARPDLDVGKVPVELGDVGLAVYRVVTDVGGRKRA
jgi:hypothetical protein